MAPVVTVKVETRMKSATCAVIYLASQVESAGSDVRGVIKVEPKAATPKTSGTSASSRLSVVLATLAIILHSTV